MQRTLHRLDRVQRTSLQRALSTVVGARFTSDASASRATTTPIAAQDKSADRARIQARIAAIDAEHPYTVAPQLVDKHQRAHSYLRISLTERCNLRCTYCMPEEGVSLTPSEQLLTADEVQRLTRLFVTAGVTKIRLTGGEPTVRKDLVEIIAGLNSLRPLGLTSIGMTSNGIALKRKLPALVKHGLDVLNISLDTLDPFKFELMTRRRGMERVLESVDEAIQQGVPRVKMNCVVIRGVNDKEVAQFVALGQHRPLDVRFIEYMPFGGNRWDRAKLVPYREMIERIEAEVGPLVKLTDDANDTSKAFRVNGFVGQVGFITSMSDHFCGTCNRLRITADGHLKACLFGNEEVSLRDLLRSGASDDALLDAIGASVQRKRARHAGMDALALSENRPMILIGG